MRHIFSTLLLIGFQLVFAQTTLAQDSNTNTKTLDSLEVRKLINIGDDFSFKQAFDSASKYYDSALQVSLSHFGFNSLSTASVYGKMANSSRAFARHDEALSYAKQNILINIYLIDPGSEFLKTPPRSNSDSLDIFYKDFLVMAEREKVFNKLPADQVNIGNIVASVFLNTYDLDKAETLTSLTSEAHSLNNSLEHLTESQNMHANVYYYKNQYNYALSLYKQALETQRKTSHNYGQYISKFLFNIGLMFGALEEFDSALIYNKKALAIHKEIFESPHPWISASYGNLGADYWGMGKLDSSEYYFDLALTSGSGDPAYIHHRKAEIQIRRGNFKKGYNTLKTAYNAIPFDGYFDQVNILNSLGDVSRKLSYYDSALYFYDEAIVSIAGPKFSPDSLPKTNNDFESLDFPVELLSTLIKKSDLFHESYQRTNELSVLRQSYDLLPIAERLVAFLRTSFITDNDNIVFSDTMNPFIKTFVQVNLAMLEATKDSFYLNEAFRFSDMNKSQVLLDAIKSSVIQQNDKTSVLHQWLTTKREIRELQSTLSDLELRNDSQKEEVEYNQKKLDELQKEYITIVETLQTGHPGLAKYIEEDFRKFDTKSFQKTLEESNSIALQFLISDESLYSFLVSPNKIEFDVQEIRIDSLNDRINELINYVSNKTDNSKESYDRFADNAEHLGRVLLNQVQGRFLDKNLILIPDGILSKIPFEVLLTEKQNTQHDIIDFQNLPFLIKERAISYSSAAELFKENMDDSRRTNSKSSGWAPFSDDSQTNELNTDRLRDMKLEKLIGAYREILPLQENFGGELYTNTRATEADFKKQLDKSKIIHIATHGIVKHDSPELSYLVFSNENDTINDGLLHLYELYDLPLNNELTILSACSTGDGEILTGEGTMSLARGFTYAGSKSVVMSLWLANDNSTSQVINKFYSHLANNETKSEALRKSKLEYLESANNLSSHPFYWAHLVTSGNNEPIIQKSEIPIAIWILAITTIIIIGFARSRKRQSKTI